MSTDLLPISCVSCRRRKIKCNKKKPCDQCTKRQLICEFPPTFRNIKILEDEFKSQPQDSKKLVPDGPIRLPEDSTTAPTSVTNSVLSSGRNKSSSEGTESRPLSSENNSISDSHSPEKVHMALSSGIDSRSDSSSSTANPLRLFSFDNHNSHHNHQPHSQHHQQQQQEQHQHHHHSHNLHQPQAQPQAPSLQQQQSPPHPQDQSQQQSQEPHHQHGRPKYDTIQYLELQEKYEMMRAANSQLLNDNRNLTQRVKELLQNSNVLSSERGGNISPDLVDSSTSTSLGSKRENDSISDDFPNKRERVGVFGHTKESFPKDSASNNLGIYSTNKRPSQDDIHEDDEYRNNEEIIKEISSTSAGSTTSSEEVSHRVPSESQFLSSDSRISPPSSRRPLKGTRGRLHSDHNIRNPHPQMTSNRIVNDWERDIVSLQDQELLRSNILVENSFKKKKLPILPSYLLKYDDPNLSSDSDTYADVFKLNFKVIMRLVQEFFEKSPYYRTFIPCVHVLEFLKKYESITDRDWNNDDDLLLVYMILCLSIQRLSPKDYVDLNLLPDASVNTCTKYRKYLTRHVIYKNFEKLRENLVHESLQTIRAYILCVEWLFMDQKYEDCWSMMFHACSVSYSIGLHIVGQYKTDEAKSNKNIYALASNTEDSDNSDKKSPDIFDGDISIENDDNADVSRFRLWYALKYYTSIICAIFGRPNPISVQVCMNNNDNGAIVPNKKLHILLKIGSGELLRLSNLMLIENYMINITFDDLMKLAAKFTKEIELLEKACKWFDDNTDETALDLSSSPSDADNSNTNNSNNSINSFMNRLGYDDFAKHPLAPTQLDVLSDTIILYINNAKLFEPFIKKFENNKDYNIIVASQINSLTKFLELSTLFVERFIKNYLEKHLYRNSSNGNTSSSSDEERAKNDQSILHRSQTNTTTNYGPVKIGRLLKTYYPFLNSLVCQGIIVIFTLLHSKSKEFVKNDESTLLNNSFLKTVEDNLNKFLNFESRMSTKFITTSRMWSSNMVYIINRVLNLIKLIYEKQEQIVPDKDHPLPQHLYNQQQQQQPLDQQLHHNHNHHHHHNHNYNHNQQQLHHNRQQQAQEHQQEQSLKDTGNKTNPQEQQGQEHNDFPITTSRGNLSYLLNPNPFGDPSQFEYLNGFHLNDPYWLSVPDDLPYYLGSQIEMDQFKNNQSKPSDSYQQE